MEIDSLLTLDEWIYNEEYSNELLKSQFNTSSLKGFGIDKMNNNIISTEFLHYLKETHHHLTQYIQHQKNRSRKICVDG